MPTLRLLVGPAARVDPAHRRLRPDLALLSDAPRRLRWRTPCASLARTLGLFYGAGGQPGLGNLLAAGHRVRVLDSWVVRYPRVPGQAQRGALVARLIVDSATFVAAATPRPSPTDAALLERTLLERTLSEVDAPGLVAGSDDPVVALDPRIIISALESVDGLVLATVVL